MSSGLFTDLYSLTMMQGYYLKNKNYTAVFDMFFRKNVNGSSFAIFAGLENLIEQICNLHFSQDDIEYLKTQNLFTDDFIEYLANFKFTGDVWAIQEGSVCFPYEPLVKIKAPIIEAQLIEGLVLNTLNFQTLVATNAARIKIAAKHMSVVEFGLRRAQGPNGALYASRAAFIGGVSATSNVLAGKKYGIPITGTMAHAWVMSYTDELQSFQDFAELYPNNVVLLIDTHNTLHSGLPNAIALGKKLKEKNISIGVRLDSGDLEYLSQEVRTALNNAGLHDARIIATNDLDEKVIAQLVNNSAPIDAVGIGTRLVTGGEDSALSGVYKLVEIINTDTPNTSTPLIKTSNNIEKSSLPSSKNLFRFIKDDKYISDLITLEQEDIDTTQTVLCHHPYIEFQKQFIYPPFTYKSLLQPYIKNGVCTHTQETLSDIQAFVQEELTHLDRTYLRQINPHAYHVSISNELKKVRDSILFNKS